MPVDCYCLAASGFNPDDDAGMLADLLSVFAAVAHTTAWRDAALTIGGEGGPGGHPAWLHHSRLTPSLLVAA